ncbi:hypothetical protein NLN82_22640 [Citrobacter portucalensis]|uniref:hypothetical protein n=1 Tax=Citrobacter portucalensis TaxID=1639133 RepID=UPI00226B6B5A|nr:hypothetical protein [Citrobacter portucalensis]MCX9038825.1 hypothetical protein [Citrobacter portucalensis]
MAKVIINIKGRGRGIEVGCQVVRDDGDSEMVGKVAEKVGAGLAGHVLAKVNEVVKKISRQFKENKHVH